MAAAYDSTTPPIPILHRRNSLGTPTKPDHLSSSCSSASASASATTTSSSSSSSSSLVDFELASIKPTRYTSLRDILPSPAAGVQSPKDSCYAVHLGYEIPIRNRLVKQAAWAYLQPMSTFPESDGTTIFHRLWTQFSGALLHLITTVVDCLLWSIHINK